MAIIKDGNGGTDQLAITPQSKSAKVSLWNNSGLQLSDVSGALNVNISGGSVGVNPFALQSGTMVLISGGQLAISGVNVVISGGFPANFSGGMTVSGGVTVSGLVGISGGTLNNLLSGTVSPYRWPTYALISYWSGAVGKGLIGVYNAGGAAGQSGKEVELVSLAVGIIASGFYDRFDLILGSGNISGSAGTPVLHRWADTASMVSGWIDGATQVSGNVIQTVDSVIAEANSSGVMHNYVREWSVGEGPRASSGQELWLRMVSGIGIGTARLEWVERNP